MMMSSQRRITTKWLSLAATILVAGCYATSIGAQWGLPIGRFGVILGCARGGLLVSTFQMPNPRTNSAPAMFNWVQSEGTPEWLPRAGHAIPKMNAGWDVKFVLIPLWIPLVAAGYFTTRVWVEDRRVSRMIARYSCKRCGYDRRGLAGTGVACPECGSMP